MIIIAHRGASGERPEHTLAAYELAIAQGADYIEPDLVLSADGVLLARHENEIGATTDVADHPEFAARRATRLVDGVEVTGWFSEDFTLAELRRLRVRERLPELRPANCVWDGQFPIPTFDEILELTNRIDRERAAAARAAGQPVPARIGVYPETKHPAYMARRGLDFQAPLLAALDQYGRTGADARIFVQSFEIGNLIRLRAARPDLALVQLIADAGGPADDPARSYAGMITPAGLREIASRAAAIGVAKSLVIPRDERDRLGLPTSLVDDAHAAGLAVHAWTFRAENHFLPVDCRVGDDPAAHGDLSRELAAFAATGLDGIFADQPGLAVRACGPAQRHSPARPAAPSC